MAKLSNSATTMLMLLCLALQADCIRQTCSAQSAAEITKAKFKSATLQRSEAADDRINTSESETDLHIKRDFKHSQASEYSELESDGESFGVPFIKQKNESFCSLHGRWCTCNHGRKGKMCIVSKTSSDRVCEYHKERKQCMAASFKRCRRNPTRICKLANRYPSSFECKCDPRELNAVFAGHDQYHLEEIIDSGGYGAVMKVKDQSEEAEAKGRKFVAVKVIPLDMVPLDKAKESIEVKMQREAAEMSARVPKVYDARESTDNLFIIQEFVDGENLFDYVWQLHEDGGIQDLKVFRIFSQLADTVRLLHEGHIIHRDIKLGNLKYHELRNFLWLLDFGFSAKLMPDRTLFDGVGTRGYRAPEILHPFIDRKYTNKVDIWAMGVVLYELVFGIRPFRDENWRGLNRKKQILKGEPNDGYQRDIDEHMSDFLKEKTKNVAAHFDPESFRKVKDLMEKMLTVDADTRITAKQVVDHPWMEYMRDRLLEHMGTTGENVSDMTALANEPEHVRNQYFEKKKERERKKERREDAPRSTA